MIDQELLRNAGVTEISCEINNPWEENPWDERRYKLSFDLNEGQIENLQKALKSTSGIGDADLKSELMTMHEVGAMPGANLMEKIDNYLTRNISQAYGEYRPEEDGLGVTWRYKIKHR